MAHAKLAPSSAVRWLTCPGSMVLSAGLPERRSMPAARGTVAHAIAAELLLDPSIGMTAVGTVFDIDGLKVTVDEAMLEAVQRYADGLGVYADGADDVLIEQKVPIGKFTGEEGATGTADALVFWPRQLQVHDAKFGWHKVEPEENWQLMLYALGALEQYGAIDDFESVMIVIHQPEHGGPREWITTPARLKKFAVRTLSGALKITRAEGSQWDSSDREWQDAYLKPSNDGCRYCPAIATCPAVTNEIKAAVADEELKELTVDGLGTSMSMVERVEAWCKGVRAEVGRRLLNREPVPGYKLVIGRRGQRKFKDAEKAEQLLIVSLGEDAHTKELISPTTAEKLLKKQQPDAWKVIAAEVTQSEGKPSVAPETDKREPYTPGASADEFEVLTEEES